MLLSWLQQLADLIAPRLVAACRRMLIFSVIQDSVIRPLMFLIFIDDCVLGVASFTIVLLVFLFFFYF